MSLLSKTGKEKGAEPGHGQDSVLKSDVCIRELDSPRYGWILAGFDKLAKRFPAVIAAFHLHRNDSVTIAQEKVHLKRRFIMPPLIEFATSLCQCLRYDVFVKPALEYPEVAVHANIITNILFEHSEQKSRICHIELVTKFIVVSCKRE